MKKFIIAFLMVVMLTYSFSNAFAANAFERLLENCFTKTGEVSALEIVLDIEPPENSCCCLYGKNEDNTVVIEYTDDYGDHYFHMEEDLDLDTCLETVKLFRGNVDVIYFASIGGNTNVWAYCPYLGEEDGFYDVWDEFVEAIVSYV